LNRGEKGIRDRPRSGRPATTETKNKVDALTSDDSRVTSELCAAIRIEKPAVMVILKRLDNRRICSRWALKVLIDENEEFYVTGMQRLTQSWKTGFIMKKNLWKNNFSFVKDVHKPWGRRRVGRPYLKWMDGVTEDLHRTRISNWKDNAGDRRAWRNILRKARTQEEF
jgi:hypothetical protein